jgi:hypothetical protein
MARENVDRRPAVRARSAGKLTMLRGLADVDEEVPAGGRC